MAKPKNYSTFTGPVVNNNNHYFTHDAPNPLTSGVTETDLTVTSQSSHSSDVTESLHVPAYIRGVSLTSSFTHGGSGQGYFLHSHQHRLIRSLSDHQGPEKTQDTSSPKLTFRDLSSRSKSILVLLASANFAHLAAYSLLAPFFPQVAVKKGVSQTEIGLIFSTFQLVVFLTAPLYGSYISTIGASFMFKAGIFTAAGTAVLFGVLEYCPGGTPFIILCFLTRLTEALAMSAFSTASFAIAAREFPQHVAFVLGIMETATSVGFMVGPVVGSLLFEIGGFGVPFYTIGAFIFIIGVLIISLLPDTKEPEVQCRPSRLVLLRSSMVWVALVSSLVVAFAGNFIDATLSLHLQGMDVSVTSIGLIFTLWALMFGLCAPGIGWITDRQGHMGPLIVTGCLGSAVGYLLIGPAPFFSGLSGSPWLVVIAAGLAGSFQAAVYIPTLKCIVVGAKDIGFEENLETFGIIAGMFNSSVALGSFLGPALGGFMAESLGFPLASTYVAIGFILLAVLDSVYFTVKSRRRNAERSEKVTQRSELVVG